MALHDGARCGLGFRQHVEKRAYEFATQDHAADVAIGDDDVIQPRLGQDSLEPLGFPQTLRDVNKHEFTISELLRAAAHTGTRHCVTGGRCTVTTTGSLVWAVANERTWTT